MKPTVYIETSVVSYLTARPSRDLIIAAHQQITRDWWDIVLPKCEAFISAIVLEETAKGDPEAARLRLNQLDSFQVLEVFEEVRRLAEAYFTATQLPERARADSYHLALASWHGLDYLVSWNCTHIVSGRVRMLVEEINATFGIRTPIICTPEELMEV
ncbi:MAG: type II toxin-antitoxin system VapC family toxin [Candidatus Competibacteraceae bacterium]